MSLLSKSNVISDADNIINKEIKLKRTIGLYDGILLILGTIIGSGIFITPTGVLGELKSVSVSLIVWAICGLVSILGAFCFAELAYLVPKTGSGYAYLEAAFAPMSRFGNLPAFLSSWLSSWAITPGCVAVIALTSGEYLVKAIVGNCQVPRTIIVLIAWLIIISATVINCYSVKWSSRINDVFSLGKIAALILIIAFGVYYLAVGKTENLTPDFNKFERSPVSWATAFFFGLYSYDGWFALNNVVEEIKNPRRNLPLAIFISLAMIIVMYLMVNISYLTLLAPEEMLASNAVALSWAEKAFKSFSFIIFLAVFIANYGSCMSMMLSSTRITYAAARDANLPRILAMIDIDNLTPSPAIYVTGLLSLLMSLSADIFALLDFFTFLIWIFYALDIVALLVIKRRNKLNIQNKSTESDDDHKLDLPLVFPLIMLLFSVGLVVVSLFKPNMGHLMALIFTLSGLVYYFPFVYFKMSFRFTDKISLYLQLFLNVHSETKEQHKN